VAFRDADGNARTLTFANIQRIVDSGRASVQITAISQDSGSAGDFVTNDPTLVYTGTVTPPANSQLRSDTHVKLELLDAGNAVVASTLVAVDSNGQWSWDRTTTTQANGSYSLRATVVDASGSRYTDNPLPGSADNGIDSQAIVIQSGNAPLITSVTDSWGNVLNAAEAAQNQSVTVNTSGVEDGRTVTVTLGGNTYTAQVSGGSATVSIAQSAFAALANGNSYNYTVSVSNAVGTPATDYSASFVVNTTPPLTPVLSAISVSADNVVNFNESQGNVTVSGSVANAANTDSISVTVGGNTYNGTINNGSFSVSVPGSVLAANTSLTVSVTASDANGNTAQASASKTYTVDVGVPTAPTALVRDTDGDGLPNISGVAEPGSTVTITGPDGVAHQVQANPSTGAYSFEYTTAPTPLTGTYSVKATDAAGNTSAPTNVNASDLSAPAAPTNLAVRDTDGDGIPTVSGTAEAGSTITITDPNGQTYTTQADGAGQFSLELPNAPSTAAPGHLQRPRHRWRRQHRPQRQRDPHRPQRPCHPDPDPGHWRDWRRHAGRSHCGQRCGAGHRRSRQHRGRHLHGRQRSHRHQTGHRRRQHPRGRHPGRRRPGQRQQPAGQRHHHRGRPRHRRGRQHQPGRQQQLHARHPGPGGQLHPGQRRGRRGHCARGHRQHRRHQRHRRERQHRAGHLQQRQPHRHQDVHRQRQRTGRDAERG